MLHCIAHGGQWEECDIACIAFPAAILSQENHKEIFEPLFLQIPEYKLRCAEYDYEFVDLLTTKLSKRTETFDIHPSIIIVFIFA